MRACVLVCSHACMCTWVIKRWSFVLSSLSISIRNGFNKAYLSWLQQKLTKTQAFKHCFYPKPCRDTMPPHNTWMTTKDNRKMGAHPLTLSHSHATHKQQQRSQIVTHFFPSSSYYYYHSSLFAYCLRHFSAWRWIKLIENEEKARISMGQIVCTQNVSKWQVQY